MAKPNLPDVAKNNQGNNEELDSVGMTGIKLPATFKIDNQEYPIMCEINCGINLKTSDRGIHMSRLYKILQESSKKALNFSQLKYILGQILESQGDLTDKSLLSIYFELPLQRRALVSNNSGCQVYPIELKSELQGDQFTLQLNVAVDYSSTCPCSFSLAKQLLEQDFSKYFNNQQPDKESVIAWLKDEKTIFPTPHSQRSTAFVDMQIKNSQLSEETIILDLIEGIEQALQTPVQTIVKREDEQEFARLNGSNLMFCEDSARRIKSWLKQSPQSQWYSHAYGRVEHYESLHSHDAFAEFSI